MKKFFLVAALAVTFVACDNSANSEQNSKDSLDSVANAQKEMIDSSAEQRKDVIDSTTENQKDAMNQMDSMNKVKDSVK